MKKLCVSFLATATCFAASAQNTFPSSGNVGIGTLTPSSLLHVSGTLTAGPVSGGYHIIINDIANARWAMGTGDFGLHIANDYPSAWTDRLFISQSGKVGIGTTAPLATFHVNANNQSSGDDAVLFDKPRTATSAASRYTFNNVGSGFWQGFHLAAPYITVNGVNTFPRLVFYSEYNSLTDPTTKKWVIHAGNSSVAHDIQFKSENTELLYLRSDGNVGIGTTNPGSYKLAVEGTLGARKVKVTQVNPWADYVFEDNYKLPSLQELEKFIRINKHLPEVPSGSEVERNGLDLGDNQALLLKKIEELTLYIINQQKEIDTLKAENKKLRN